MEILKQKSRSILPQIESLYLVSRLAIFVGLIAYIIFGPFTERYFYPLLFILGAFLLHLAGIWVWFVQKRRTGFNRTYVISFVFDLLLFTALTRLSGGTGSDYYVLYYISVAFAGYVFALNGVILFCTSLTVAYLIGNFDTLSVAGPLVLALRIGTIWLIAITINYVAEYIRKSENRLLNLFNTLNSRTSELEKMQARLEMVHENSRILAGILDFDHIISGILTIGERVLDYPALGVILVGPAGNLIYRGRLVGGHKNTRLKAIDPASMELVMRIFRGVEPVRVNDLTVRNDYQPLLKSAQSAMLVPMVTHGKITGLLTAESPRKAAFTDQDEKFLLVLARSAAMALENAILHRKTEELTIKDDLTGIYNYRYFAEKIKEEVRRAVRYDQPLSLIMLDIDWFKRFNDDYGHEVGNHVLSSMVSVIKRCIRDVDILCRYGGEEFIIILPLTAEREAEGIAERIRTEIGNSSFGGGEGMPLLRVTVSVGVTSYPENGRGEREIINAVDQALYRAKGSGKNTVCTV